jgi:exopolysaccharide biosynthesis WecB/TagA/CpsF family protein
MQPNSDHLALVFEDRDLPGFLPLAANFGTREYGYVTTPNVDGLIRLHDSESFRASYARAAYVLLDSRVASFLIRLVHGVRVPVCPGSDLTAALFQQVIGPEDRVVVVGSTEEQVQMLRQRFGLKHLLHHNPPMGFINDPAAVEACLQFVESCSPFRFCLVAVGDPQGVIISHQLIERGKARGLALAIGASIDFMTGKQRRAPVWMQRAGLEWLHRLLSNPRRLARRYLVRCPRFLVQVFKSRIVLRQPA